MKYIQNQTIKNSKTKQLVIVKPFHKKHLAFYGEIIFGELLGTQKDFIEIPLDTLNDWELYRGSPITEEIDVDLVREEIVTVSLTG